MEKYKKKFYLGNGLIVEKFCETDKSLEELYNFYANGIADGNIFLETSGVDNDQATIIPSNKISFINIERVENEE